MSLRVRPAATPHLPAVNALRNHFVRTCTAIYTDVERSDAEAAAWFAARDPVRHPLLVAEVDGRFAGFGMLSAFDPMSGYADTVEDSVYVEPAAGGQGVGTMLLGELLRLAERAGHVSVVARIDAGQQASLRLHERHGFTKVGTLRMAGRKFGRRLDVVYLQRLIREDVEGEA